MLINRFIRQFSHLVLLMLAALSGRAQSVAFLYDLRHTTDPTTNPRNFSEIEFKYLKTSSFGTFLMKEEIDLDGTNHNASKIYSQLSQSIALGKSKVALHLGYSGGLGLFNDATGGYYLLNSYELGLEHAFGSKSVFGNMYVAARYTNAKKPSYDPMAVIYVGRGFFNYKVFGGVDVEAWTTNRNLGDAWNNTLRGKQTSCLIEAEVWYKLGKNLSAGTLTRIAYGVYTADTRWVVYPTLGIRYEF